MTRPLVSIGNRLPLLALALLSVILAWRNLTGALPPQTPFSALIFPEQTDTAAMLAHYTMLPRIAVALLAGAALGLAGAILQRVLRNPLIRCAWRGRRKCRHHRHGGAI